MTRWIHWGLCLCLALTVAACDGKTEDQNGTEPAKDEGITADAMATPKGSITYQVQLLKAGKLEEFKACFTDRLKDRITAEAMTQGAQEVGSMSLDDLFASSQDGESDGKKTCKVKMANGRTLTTLVLTDGKWLADTIWFK
jgi:hypothetical protein